MRMTLQAARAVWLLTLCAPLFVRPQRLDGSLLRPLSDPVNLRRGERSVVPQPNAPHSCSSSSPLPSQPDNDVREIVDDALGALRSNAVTADRRKTAVLYARNVAVNRALFFSLALQLLNGTREFPAQPGFLLHYSSAATAVFAGPRALGGSGVFFGANKHYPNWHKGVWFNGTMPRFAPYASRQTSSELRVDDYGADVSAANTSADTSSGQAGVMHTVRVESRNKYGDVTSFGFYTAGAPSDVTPIPVTSDLRYVCPVGADPRWLLTLTAPVVDVLPRYTFYTFLQKPRHVAVTSADVDVQQLTPGMPTEVPLFHNMLVPMLDCGAGADSPSDRSTLSSNFFTALYPQSRLALRLAHSLSAFLQNRRDILSFVRTHLVLASAGDFFAQLDILMSNSIEDFVSPWRDAQGHINGDPFQNDPGTPSFKIKVDEALNDTLLRAEVLANVLTDTHILGSGIFYDVGNAGEPRRAFFSWRSSAGAPVVVADVSTSRTFSVNSRLTSASRTQWGSSRQQRQLDTFTYHAGIRSSRTGGGLADFEVDPLQYRATSLGGGQWTSPYLKCDGKVDQVVVTYAAPFFGPSASDPSALAFRGIVTVDIGVTEENWRV